MNSYLDNKANEFNKLFDFFKKDIATLRTGRVSTSLLDNVQVEAYDVLNPLNAVANLSVSDARSILLSVWDKGIIKDVEKAILEADLGFSIINDGDKLRLSTPPLTEENRRDLVKKLNEKMEKVRINLRQLRESIKQAIERDFADKTIDEDQKFRSIKDLDEYIAKKNDELKEIRDAKEADIMEI